MQATATSAPPRGTPVAAGYRPWLDGVRAVAIALVLCRHLGFGWARHAGGPGVALFFALSGYLITGLLLDERMRGPIDLAGFYIRRAARLLPALVVMLAVSDVWYILRGTHGVIGESLSVLFYFKNYRDAVVGGQGLFGQAWSLSVEEHFYLVWPVVLLVMAARWRHRRLFAATLALAGAALVWRVVLVAIVGTGHWVYVETGARADSLLVGCALAIAVRSGVQVPKAVTAASVLVFAWVVSPVWHPPLIEQTVGYAVQSVACALIVAGLDTVDSPLRNALSVRPVVWLGVLSYGIYLWHVSVLHAMPLRGALYDVACVAATILLAATSYRFVERPARNWARAADLRWRLGRKTADAQTIGGRPASVIRQAARQPIGRRAPHGSRMPATQPRTDSRTAVAVRARPSVSTTHVST